MVVLYNQEDRVDVDFSGGNVLVDSVDDNVFSGDVGVRRDSTVIYDILQVRNMDCKLRRL